MEQHFGKAPDGRRAVVRNIAAVPWHELPDHHGGALSKLLVGPDATGAALIDHRISCYQPMAHVVMHAHAVQEQVYHVLQGEGLMQFGDEHCVVRAHDVVFIPPGIAHAISNSGLVDLVFLVVTTPVSDAP